MMRYSARLMVVAAVLSCALKGLPASRAAAPDAAPPATGAPPPVASPALSGDAARTEASIVSPREGAEISESQVLVTVAVRVPQGSKLIGLRALIDGRLAAQLRGVKLVSTAAAPTGEPRSMHLLTVTVPSRDCALTVLAESSVGKSQPAVINLRWKGTASTPEQTAALQPKLYVLSIGVSAYQRPELRLRLAAKDARDLSATFQAQRKTLYRAIESKVLLDQQATKANILDALEWLQRQTTAKDVAVLFLAGHGITDPGSGTYYYLPYDADPDAIKRTMLPESEVRTTLASIAGKVLLFLDTCHSGKVFGSTQLRGAGDLSAFIDELASAESGVVVFAASTGRQASQESADWNNGAFTKAVIEGLRGRADTQRTGRITLNMLDLYISERVKELTQGRQTPTTAKPATIPDFPIAVARDLSNEDIDLLR